MPDNDSESRYAGAVTGDQRDPTHNVSNLLLAAVQRLDDLAAAERIRVNELTSAERRRVDEQAALRAFYDEKLRDAEAKRIDAIRVVDVNAVAVANERQSAAASVLANQVSASAETLRGLVATTAATAAQQFQQVTSQMSERIAALEKASYEGQGRGAYTDPLLGQLLVKVDSLQASRSEISGKGAGVNASWVVVLGAISAISALIGIVGTIVAIVISLRP